VTFAQGFDESVCYEYRRKHVCR